MDVPMHRFKYTKLSKEQIGQKLASVTNGPASASELSDALVGKALKIVTDNGPVLNYTFKNKNRLTLAEGSEPAIECGYGALDLTPLVLFSHMDPKTQKGFNVVIDQNTRLVTVLAVWFSSAIEEKTMGGREVLVDDREVQRQIYFGYVETSDGRPKERHSLTNRLEGKGIHWKQDNGIEVIDLYASLVSTNFVELTRHHDDLSYCAPSDYVIINDHLFVYDRTECEFSGIHTMFAMDLYAMKQVGVRLGFNENDELEYSMFRGEGEVVGQLAHLEPFSDRGNCINLAGPSPDAEGNVPPIPKGQRYAYRPIRDFDNVTEDLIFEAAKTTSHSFVEREDIPQTMAGNRLPYSDLLAGKAFTLRYDHDGPVWNYRILDKENLEWKSEDESEWHKEIYRAFEADESLVFFSHMHTGSKPCQSVQIALDLTNGLTTCIHSKMGTEYFGNEAAYHALFGVAEMEGIKAPRYMRHGYTDELVGQAYSWTYSEQMTSMHIYTTPHSSSWTIFTNNQAMGAQWCAPCLYVKLRPGVYIFCLCEEACNGAEMCVCINTNSMHDCGFGFMGGNLMGGGQGISLGPIGAIARHIGAYDIKQFFGPKKRI
ncbi:MAG TPA: MoaF N-terminal domain-containing protein [Anaerolineae bacterium]|nr:MoaF N-terminal domain-containing protein [Anaerolineae bacterium]HQH39742.1 MoaF N-terminal domain-containing protein [Anaerolineae bacterium]